MNQKKDIIKSIVVLTLICLAVSAALAVVNHYTAPVSAANAIAREDAIRRSLLPDAAGFEPLEDAPLPENITGAYVGTDADGAAIGYIFTVNGRGFGGTISIMCAIDTQGAMLKCGVLDVSGETKTLGGKVANDSYTDQYRGTDADLTGVETISGATVTSKAFESCVREAFEAYSVAKGADA